MSDTQEQLFPCPCCGALVHTTQGAFEICKNCEWEDDPVQSSDPDFEGGANEPSLNQAIKEWLEKQLCPCPCCGALVHTIKGGYEICDICEWQDDPVQSSDPDFEGGANEPSLNQAIREWLEKNLKAS